MCVLPLLKYVFLGSDFACSVKQGRCFLICQDTFQFGRNGSFCVCFDTMANNRAAQEIDPMTIRLLQGIGRGFTAFVYVNLACWFLGSEFFRRHRARAAVCLLVVLALAGDLGYFYLRRVVWSVYCTLCEAVQFCGFVWVVTAGQYIPTTFYQMRYGLNLCACVSNLRTNVIWAAVIGCLGKS